MTGKELKSKIEQINVSQKSLADKLGVTPQSISAILSAKDIRTSTLERIAEVLGVDVAFFYPSRTTINGENTQVNSKGNLVMGDNNGAVGGDQHVGDPAQADVITKLIEQNTKLINMLAAQQNK